MLTRLTASRYDRPASTGRTRPVHAAGITLDDEEIEVILKCSGGCDRGVSGLASEMMAACLAADLRLPVPEPFLVEISPAWIAGIADDSLRATLSGSSPLAFGSHRVARGFVTWSSGTRLGVDATSTAAAILAFDAFTQNSDRRPENPNLLVRGDDLRMIDHELAFSHRLVLGWQPPWVLGGLQPFGLLNAHVLARTVREARPDWAPVRTVWTSLADARLQAYRAALPPEWAAAAPLVDDACKLIADVRDRIDDCLVELQRVLT